MATDIKDIKDKVYPLLPALVNNAESISWNRFNSLLLFSSILILSWTNLYKTGNTTVLSATPILGLISCFVWCALGLRGRKNVSKFLKIGEEFEKDSYPQPFTEAMLLRNTQPFSWAGSIYTLTLIPLLIAMLYALLLWLSIANLIVRIILTTIAVVLIIVFLCLILGYISREKKNI